MSAYPFREPRERERPAPAQYEQDRKLGIISGPAVQQLRHIAAYEDCPRGPRCVYPVACCLECRRHHPGGHRGH